MSEVIRGYWAHAICNHDFICVETYSGYRGGTNVDPKGKRLFLSPDVGDDVLGAAVLNAIAHSRFVLGAPREGSSYPPDVEFDMELYDYKLNIERHAQWVKDLMTRYGYKTKRALYKGMRNCSIENQQGVLTIGPYHHSKLDMWERGDIENVVIPAESTSAEIGAALRLGFSRCTE